MVQHNYKLGTFEEAAALLNTVDIEACYQCAELFEAEGAPPNAARCLGKSIMCITQLARAVVAQAQRLEEQQKQIEALKENHGR